jgi:hypothetical protein
MKRNLWYIGDSFVDHKYVGRDAHAHTTSWVQQLPLKLGYSVKNCACAGASNDWTVGEFVKRRTQWQAKDVVICSITDPSRMNIRKLPVDLQSKTAMKEPKIFRQLWTEQTAYIRIMQQVAWLQGLAHQFHKVIVIMPFGTTAPVNNDRTILREDLSTLVAANSPENFWLYPRQFHSYDMMQHQPSLFKDTRPNHMYPECTESLMRSFEGFLQQDQRVVYEPYLTMSNKSDSTVDER